MQNLMMSLNIILFYSSCEVCCHAFPRENTFSNHKVDFHME